MQAKSLSRALTLGCLTLAVSGLAAAQEQWNYPDFSATQVFESRRGEMKIKVYRSGQSVRVERSAALSTLYTPANKKVYNLTTYPDHSHQCVSMTPEQARMLPSPLQLIQGKVVKRQAAGSEIVDGHKTRIEDVTVMQLDGKTIESKVWHAVDLQNIPIEIESYIKSTTLKAYYRDIHAGALDKALFQVPDVCTPFERMGVVAEMSVVK
jgi:hypothetical protein